MSITARPSAADWALLPRVITQVKHMCCLAEWAVHAVPLCSLQSVNQAHSNQGQLESGWKLVSLFPTVECCYAESTARKLAVILKSSFWWPSQFAFSSQFSTYFRNFGLKLCQKRHNLFISQIYIMWQKSSWASTFLFISWPYWIKSGFFLWHQNLKMLKTWNISAYRQFENGTLYWSNTFNQKLWF